jgi:glutamine synthetase
MCYAANPLEKHEEVDTTGKQTFEMRSPDCSADIYQLMAGLCVAVRYGLSMPEKKALKIAEDKYVSMDIHKPENAAKLASLASLPTNCSESADCLEKSREVFESEGVFTKHMIDGIIYALRSFNDKGLLAKASNDPDLMAKIVKEYFYCG